MLIALVMLPIITITELGGLTATEQKLTDINPDFANLFNGFSWLGFISLMAWGLGYFGQPHILSRFMAIRSRADIPKSRNIAMLWMIVALIGALAVGLVGSAYFADSPLDNSETVFIYLTQALLNPWLAGILIAAILSAIMSTIDSQLLVCSSVIVEDFYKHVAKKPATEHQLVWLSRFALLLIAVIATIIATNPESSILDLVSYAWAGFGAAFGPTVLLALYWPKYSKQGTIATIITGAVVVIVWKQLNGGIFDLYEIVPGFVFATIVGYFVSRISFEPSVEQTFIKLNKNS